MKKKMMDLQGLIEICREIHNEPPPQDKEGVPQYALFVAGGCLAMIENGKTEMDFDKLAKNIGKNILYIILEANKALKKHRADLKVDLN